MHSIGVFLHHFLSAMFSCLNIKTSVILVHSDIYPANENAQDSNRYHHPYRLNNWAGPISRPTILPRCRGGVFMQNLIQIDPVILSCVFLLAIYVLHFAFGQFVYHVYQSNCFYGFLHYYENLHDQPNNSGVIDIDYICIWFIIRFFSFEYQT